MMTLWSTDSYDKETKEKVEGIKIEIYEAIEKEEVDEQGNIVVDEQGNPKTTTEKGKLVLPWEEESKYVTNLLYLTHLGAKK